jgi:predicted GIY-YIG superfamily endonuclease
MENNTSDNFIIKNNSISDDDIIQNTNRYYCYILRSLNPNFPNSTYNGSTNNLTRRLRQHNGEITGGAKATRGKGPWVYIAVWEGFGSHKEALSCEWRIKHPTNTRKRPVQFNGVAGRIKSLNLLIGLDNWTNKSTGMGLRKDSDYCLKISDQFIGLIDLEDKKTNLKIKLLT